MNKARWFFEEMVKGAFAEWQRDPLSEIRARCAAGFVNDMAEWAHEHLSWPTKPRTPGKFRDDKKIHGAFRIVVDVANGTKHVKLTKGDPVVTRAEQTYRAQYKTFDDVEDLDSLDDLDSLSVWIVELDDGSRYCLRPLIEESIHMWDRFLERNGA